jgi:hypothetical protein
VGVLLRRVCTGGAGGGHWQYMGGRARVGCCTGGLRLLFVSLTVRFLLATSSGMPTSTSSMPSIACASRRAKARSHLGSGVSVRVRVRVRVRV